MPYKNIKELLTAATNLPAAIEAKLPAGAPKLSTMLVDTAGKIPTMPDFPMTIPDLPAVPELPAMPGGTALRKYVTGVTVVPMAPTPGAPTRTRVTPLEQAYTQPIEGVVGTVTSRRGM